MMVSLFTLCYWFRHRHLWLQLALPRILRVPITNQDLVSCQGFLEFDARRHPESNRSCSVNFRNVLLGVFKAIYSLTRAFFVCGHSLATETLAAGWR